MYECQLTSHLLTTVQGKEWATEQQIVMATVINKALGPLV